MLLGGVGVKVLQQCGGHFKVVEMLTGLVRQGIDATGP